MVHMINFIVNWNLRFDMYAHIMFSIKVVQSLLERFDMFSIKVVQSLLERFDIFSIKVVQSLLKRFDIFSI